MIWREITFCMQIIAGTVAFTFGNRKELVDCGEFMAKIGL